MSIAMTDLNASKLLVCKTVKACENDFVEMSFNDIMNDMVLSNNAMYEILHPRRNKWIKPYFDIDDKTCTVSREYLHDNILAFLNTIFTCDNDDWAICDDSRKSKSSYHITLTTHQTTINDMTRLKNHYIDKFKQLNIDISVYSNGYQKMRMVNCKHEIDTKSTGLKPISFVNHNETHKHIISIVENEAKIFTFDKVCNNMSRNVNQKRLGINAIKLSQNLKTEIAKYKLLSELKNKNGLLIADIKLDCYWNTHKNNNRYYYQSSSRSNCVKVS